MSASNDTTYGLLLHAKHCLTPELPILKMGDLACTACIPVGSESGLLD